MQLLAKRKLSKLVDTFFASRKQKVLFVMNCVDYRNAFKVDKRLKIAKKQIDGIGNVLLDKAGVVSRATAKEERTVRKRCGKSTNFGTTQKKLCCFSSWKFFFKFPCYCYCFCYCFSRRSSLQIRQAEPFGTLTRHHRPVPPVGAKQYQNGMWIIFWKWQLWKRQLYCPLFKSGNVSHDVLVQVTKAVNNPRTCVICAPSAIWSSHLSIFGNIPLSQKDPKNEQKLSNLVPYLNQNLCESLHVLCHELEQSGIDTDPIRVKITTLFEILSASFLCSAVIGASVILLLPLLLLLQLPVLLLLVLIPSALSILLAFLLPFHPTFDYLFSTLIVVEQLVSTSSYFLCRKSCWVWEILSSPLCLNCSQSRCWFDTSQNICGISQNIERGSWMER